MRHSFPHWLVATTTSARVLGWLVLMLLLVSCFGLYLVPVFTAHMNGLMPIDLAFPVTPETIAEHLAVYDARARELYAQFLLIDCLYPPALAMFMASWWAQMFKLIRFPSRGYYLLWLPFVGAALDLAENGMFATLIWSVPGSWSYLDLCVSVVRGLKLAVQATSFCLSLLFAYLWLRNRFLRNEHF